MTSGDDRRLEWVAIALLAVLALTTRLPAPGRAEVIGDEMLLLESWRNRYRTGDMMPLFLRRLERHPALSPGRKAALAELYRSSPCSSGWSSSRATRRRRPTGSWPRRSSPCRGRA